MDRRSDREQPPSSWQPIILGSMMVIVGILMTVVRLFPITIDGESIFRNDTNFGLMSRMLLILGGAVIIYNRKKGNYVAVGIYALTLGISRVIRSIPGLCETSDLKFYIALVFTIIGGNLAYGGYNHLTVRTRNPTTMKYVSILLLVGYSLAFGFTAYIGSDVINMTAVFLSDIDMMGFIPLYVGLLIVLYSKEILENNPIGRISTFMSAASNMSYSGNEAHISYDDMKKIEEGFSGAESWDDYIVGDITVKESAIVIHADRVDRDVILQKWSDSNVLYMSLINDRRDSFVRGDRLWATDYEYRDNTLYLYDEHGECAVLRVGDA